MSRLVAELCWGPPVQSTRRRSKRPACIGRSHLSVWQGAGGLGGCRNKSLSSAPVSATPAHASQEESQGGSRPLELNRLANDVPPNGVKVGAFSVPTAQSGAIVGRTSDYGLSFRSTG